MAEEQKKQRGTTVWIDPDTLVALEGYCSRYSVTKKDFVKYAVEWFEKNEVDITSETTYAHANENYQQLKRDQKQLPAVKDQIQAMFSMVESLPDAIKGIPQAMADAIKENSANLATHEDVAAQSKKIDILLSDRRKLQGDIVQYMEEYLRMRARLEEALRELERCRSVFSKPNERVISAIKKELQQ